MNYQKGNLITAVLIIAAGVVMIAILIGAFRRGEFNRLTPENLFNPNFRAGSVATTEPPNGYLFELGVQNPPDQNEQDSTVAVSQCVPEISEPQINQRITIPFMVRGSVVLCEQWPVVDGRLGTVEVYIDGEPVSVMFDLVVTNQSSPYTFEAFIDQVSYSAPFASLVFKNNDFENENAQAFGLSVEF